MKDLVNKLGEKIITITKDENLSLSESISLLEEIETYVLDALVCEHESCKPGERYVLKFEGYLEKYSSKKIAYSLERAASALGDNSYINQSDISLIVRDVERNFGSRVVIKSSELRKWVKDSLDTNGYGFLKEKYSG